LPIPDYQTIMLPFLAAMSDGAVRRPPDVGKLLASQFNMSDGEQLAQLMMDFGVGVTEVDTYKVKKLDRDYFKE
jgi:restriction endonuclease Mrr